MQHKKICRSVLEHKSNSDLIESGRKFVKQDQLSVLRSYNHVGVKGRELMDN